MIDWDTLTDSDLKTFGKYLYWAEEWATFKTMTAAEMRNSWRIELIALLTIQEKLRDTIAKRKIPWKGSEPSHMPAEAISHLS